MSSPNPMTREELIENAALDAFGFLDDYEAALYTRSFHHAPAAVQDEIIRMQADIVSDETPLPDVTPDETLRDRVLDAVAGAIERETAQLEPLATIGRPRHKDADIVGSIIPGTAWRIWRAAAFVLSATVIVVSYFCVEAVRQNHQLMVEFLNYQTDEQLQKEIGPPIKNFIFDSATKWKLLKSTTAGSVARATLAYREDQDVAILVVEDLPWNQDQEYILTAKSAKGVIEQHFNMRGQLAGVRVALNGLATALSTMTIEITDRAGHVILSTT